jgi:hypothetical protein
VGYDIFLNMSLLCLTLKYYDNSERLQQVKLLHINRFLPLLRRFNPAEPVVEKSAVLNQRNCIFRDVQYL